MPNNAVMIGRPIASSDPNAISRMTTAASMPISSLAGCVWSVNMEPPSSTCSVGEFASFGDAAHVRREVDRHVVRLHVEEDLGVRDLSVSAR